MKFQTNMNIHVGGVRSFEEGSHLCFINKKIEQCHKLLLVLGGGLALIRGAVCGALKI